MFRTTDGVALAPPGGVETVIRHIHSRIVPTRLGHRSHQKLDRPQRIRRGRSLRNEPPSGATACFSASNYEVTSPPTHVVGPNPSAFQCFRTDRFHHQSCHHLSQHSLSVLLQSPQPQSFAVQNLSSFLLSSLPISIPRRRSYPSMQRAVRSCLSPVR